MQEEALCARFALLLNQKTSLAASPHRDKDCRCSAGSEPGRASLTSPRRLRQQVKDQRSWRRSELSSFVQTKSLFCFSFLITRLPNEVQPKILWHGHKIREKVLPCLSQWMKPRQISETEFRPIGCYPPWYVIPMACSWQWHCTPQSGEGAWRRPGSFACPTTKGIPLRKVPGFDVGIPRWIIELKWTVIDHLKLFNAGASFALSFLKSLTTLGHQRIVRNVSWILCQSNYI